VLKLDEIHGEILLFQFKYDLRFGKTTAQIFNQALQMIPWESDESRMP
jgi:hypothetical protein